MTVERLFRRPLSAFAHGTWVRHGVLAALVAALVLGVVAMHAMSSAASHHHTTVPFSSPGAGAVSALGSPPDTIPGQAHADEAHTHAPEDCADGDCGGHGMLTAMCLMVLVVVIGAARPRLRKLPWGAYRAVRRTLPPAGLGVASLAGPSLVALGISRT